MSLGSVIADAVKQLAPLVETAVGVIDPAAATLITEATTILTGVANLEPTAVAVYTKIVSGDPYTDAEITADMAAYDADYQQAVTDAEAKGATE
jgi:hypothetical protein